jgi:AcrR family transcriptional regulator
MGKHAEVSAAAVVREPRVDARRNRERVLDAARSAFAEQGLSVPLDEIARRAGVGPGTVHRHFPTKETLFEAVVMAGGAELATTARELAADPSEGFYRFFRLLVERTVINKALCQALEAQDGTRLAPRPGLAAEVRNAVTTLLAGAQRAGAVRDDVSADEAWALCLGCVAMERQRGQSIPLGRMTAVALEVLQPKPRDETGTISSQPRCAQCGTPITEKSTGRPARYCGAPCRKRAHRDRSAR